MPLHSETTIRNTYSTITINARQYNPYSRLDKETRKVVLKANHLDGNFDIHSTIFSIAKLLNTGEFDCDWDLKRELFENYDNYSEAEKEEIKVLLNRCFFTKSCGQAWTKYHYMMRHKPREVSKETFENIYSLVQEMTCGTLPYVYNIWFYESLFELLVLQRMVERGYDVANVYDCFYFNTSQVSIEEVKTIITDIANEYNTYLSLLLSSPLLLI